jgi:hypothetical protein
MLTKSDCERLLSGDDWTVTEGESGGLPYVIATRGAERARWDEDAPGDVRCCVSLVGAGRAVAEAHGRGVDAEGAFSQAVARAARIAGVAG